MAEKSVPKQKKQHPKKNSKPKFLHPTSWVLNPKQASCQKVLSKFVADAAKMAESMPDRDVPLPPIKVVFGTQFVTMRLYFPLVVINSSAGSIINAVRNVDPGLTISWSGGITALFDEYLPIRGGFEFISQYLGGTTGSGIIGMVIDYDNAGALSSYNSLLVYDSKKVFHTHNQQRVRIEFTFDRSPDVAWFNVSATSAVCWLKMYGDSTTGLGASSNVGSTIGWIDVAFRQA